MENWITEFMNDFGYMGIFLLIALENIFRRSRLRSFLLLAVT